MFDTQKTLFLDNADQCTNLLNEQRSIYRQHNTQYTSIAKPVTVYFFAKVTVKYVHWNVLSEVSYESSYMFQPRWVLECNPCAILIIQNLERCDPFICIGPALNLYSSVFVRQTHVHLNILVLVHRASHPGPSKVTVCIWTYTVNMSSSMLIGNFCFCHVFIFNNLNNTLPLHK